MALFGLSPLFLSLLASMFFTTEANGLDVTRFVSFMAILAGVVHIIGAINLRTPTEVSVNRAEAEDSRRDEENNPAGNSDERTPLIRNKSRPSVQVSITPVEHEQTVAELLKDPYFWMLGFCTLICLGSVSIHGEVAF